MPPKVVEIKEGVQKAQQEIINNPTDDAELDKNRIARFQWQLDDLEASYV